MSPLREIVVSLGCKGKPVDTKEQACSVIELTENNRKIKGLVTKSDPVSICGTFAAWLWMVAAVNCLSRVHDDLRNYEPACSWLFQFQRYCVNMYLTMLTVAILCCSGLAQLPLDQAVFDQCMASPARTAQVEAMDRRNTSDLMRKFGKATLPVGHRRALDRLVLASPVLKGRRVLLLAYDGMALNAHEADHNVIIISAAAWNPERGLAEDEVAAMLAHEVAHLERRDSQRMACESLAYASNADLSLPSAIRETAREVFSGPNQLSAALADLSQGRENAADVRGAQLLAQAGYNPLAMARMLRKLAPPGAFSSVSHPEIDARVQNVLRSVYAGGGQTELSHEKHAATR